MRLTHRYSHPKAPGVYYHVRVGNAVIWLDRISRVDEVTTAYPWPSTEAINMLVDLGRAGWHLLKED